jgi:type IV secretion system protein VirB8
MSKPSEFENYMNAGYTWDREIFANMQQSRNRAWLLSFVCMGIAVLSLITLVLILPLKTFEPYVVTVDRSTGYLEVTKGLAEGNLTQDEAITEANLVKYVASRESYNPAILRENYDFVSLLSTGKALTEFRSLWDGKNPNNPSIIYGRQTSIDIKIQSVSFITDKTASIRFLRKSMKITRSKRVAGTLS